MAKRERKAEMTSRDVGIYTFENREQKNTNRTE